jgi:hypothetical protein
VVNDLLILQIGGSSSRKERLNRTRAIIRPALSRCPRALSRRGGAPGGQATHKFT